MVDLYGFHVGKSNVRPMDPNGSNLNPNDLQVLASAESARKLFKTLGDKHGIPREVAKLGQVAGGWLYSPEGLDLTTA